MTNPRDHALDGLRGISALLFVLGSVASMTWLPISGRSPTVLEYLLSHLEGPAIAISLVLSGHVVTMSLIKRHQDYAGYLLSRATRLYPIAWAGVLAGIAIRLPGIRPPSGASAALAGLSATPIATDAIALATLLIPMGAERLVNPPLWVVTAVFQISIIMPVIAATAARWPWTTGIGICAALAAAAILTASAWPLLLCGFAIGAATAGAEIQGARAKPRARKGEHRLMAMGVAILSAPLLLDTSDRMTMPACAVGAAMVIIAVRRGIGREWLSRRRLRQLGRLSYPLYAVHWPVMAAGIMLLGHDLGITAAAIAAIPVSLLAAGFLARTIEVPAVILSHLVKSRPLAIPQ